MNLLQINEYYLCYRCIPCSKDCPFCEPSGVCSVRQDVYIKTAILCIQLTCMAITMVLALMVFKQRKTKVRNNVAS